MTHVAKTGAESVCACPLHACSRNALLAINFRFPAGGEGKRQQYISIRRMVALKPTQKCIEAIQHPNVAVACLFAYVQKAHLCASCAALLTQACVIGCVAKLNFAKLAALTNPPFAVKQLLSINGGKHTVRVYDKPFRAEIQRKLAYRCVNIPDR